MEVTTLDLEHRLRDAGLRVTRSRTTVLAAVQAHPHADTEMVVDVARRTLSDLSRQAVHDSLRALVDVGLVRRFQLGSVVRFETPTGDDHHHAVCTSCGRIADVDCVGGGLSCLAPADSRGFLVSAVEVVYQGLCPDCAGRSGGYPRPLGRHDDRLPVSQDGTRPEPERLVRQPPEVPASPAPLPSVAEAAARTPSHPAGRRARRGRAASTPPPETSAPQPDPPGSWTRPDSILSRREGLPASHAGPKHQPSRPEADPRTSPEPVVRDEPAPTARHPRSRREANKPARPTAPVEGVDHGASTRRPTADAPPTRRRPRHEAPRPQPV